MIASLDLAADTQAQTDTQAQSDTLQSFQQQIDREWTIDSAIDPDLAAQTLEIVPDTLVDLYTHEPSYPIHEALNWTLTRFGQQARRHEFAALILNDDRSVWQAKLSHPKRDRADGKPRKYEMPKGSTSRAWLPYNLPLTVWQRIAQRYDASLTDHDRQQGFRTWLIHQPQIPLIVCEGAKKAACLLSLGYAAIALPGIFNGYRSATQQLIDDLQAVAVRDRPIYICFDHDLKPRTIENVNLATHKLGKLFAQAGCDVRVIQLPGPEKGVDDFVVAQGRAAFDALFEGAIDLPQWSSTQQWALTYTPTLTLNQRYLDALPFPESGFAFVKSPKGTGKTRSLEPLIRQATQTGRRVLVITHRIQLGKTICHRIGIDWIDEMHRSETQGWLGYGLCIDSLHPNSRARFNPQDWKGAIAIFDEVEQVIWHVLNSATCREHRVAILETLKDLIHVLATSGGLIIGQDADLSDVSVDYLLSLATCPPKPWLAMNEWKSEQGWDVTLYDTSDATPLIEQMQTTIGTGPVFICLDAQKAKSRLGSINLEAYLKQQFPTKRILRIDSETVSDPNHPACGAVERLDQVVTAYDIVIATPTIGTGVSIDVRNYFVAVFGIFHGTTPDSETRQALARVRDDVPRIVWAQRFGFSKVGNGSCSYRDVIRSTTQTLRQSLQLLRDVDFDLDSAHDPVTLRTWAKMAARVNTSLWNFREELQQGLDAEGHRITRISDIESIAPVQRTIATLQSHCQQLEAEMIANAEPLTEAEYYRLRDQRTKSPVERYRERHYQMTQRYGITVTPDLVLKDNDGWHSTLRLHYYLLNDLARVQQHDVKELRDHLQRGQHKLALQDVKLLGAQVQALRQLGIPDLLNPSLEIRAGDELVQTIVQQAIRFRADLKLILNLTLTERMSDMQIVQALLNKLGLKLQLQRQERKPDGTRCRVYCYLPPTDDRERIFAVWQQRDELLNRSPNLIHKVSDRPDK